MLEFLKGKKPPHKLITAKYLSKKYKIHSKKKIFELPIPLNFSKPIFTNIFFQVLLCGGYGFIISLLYQYKLIAYFTDNQVFFNIFIGLNIALGLLLVIRTNNAQARFWEGYKLWRAMSNNVCNLTRGIWLYIEEQEPSARSEKETAIWLTAAFSVAMKLHLRGQSINSELKSLVSLKQYNLLQHIEHPCLELTFWLSDYLDNQYKQGRLNIFQLTELQSSLDSMIDILGNCERINNRSTSIVSNAILNILLIVYFLLSPLGLVASLNWSTSLVIASISFIFLSINEVGVEIEEPFGNSPNDIPLDYICEKIMGNVEDLIGHAPGSHQVINLPKRTA